MKNKSIISLFIFLSGFGITTTSCEDMLTPDVDLYAEDFTGKDTVNFYLGILANVQGVIENNVLLGELRGDLTTSTEYVSDTVADVHNFIQQENTENGLLNRAAYYKVINQCNFYLAKVDTMAQKNNIYYMRREFAQVQMIRAWTYMQLVQNYGRVPFITKPVDNANTGWETNPEGDLWATADNLLDLLKGAGLDRAYAYEKSLGLPSYHRFNTGAVEIPALLTTFPGDLVMGDLYLLRSKGQSDYEQAAQHYYTYLDENGADNDFTFQGRGMSWSKNTMNGTEQYSVSSTNWGSWIVGNYALNSTNITVVPSAANQALGKVVNRIQQVYGFDSHSTSSVQEGEGENEETTVSGSISLKANYKNRQVVYSNKYQKLNKAQLSHYTTYDNNMEIRDVEYTGLGDGRYYGTVADRVYTEVGELPFIQKMSFSMGGSSMRHNTSSFSFPYVIPVYRIAQVYLRFAEAINRAGFPRHAFAILAGGWNNEKMPVIMDSLAYNADSTQAQRVLYTEHVIDGANWIDVDELRRAQEKPYLDFSEAYWTGVGVHGVGCGWLTDKDTLYTYDRIVYQRIAEETALNAAINGGTTPDEPQPAPIAQRKRMGRGTVVDGVEILPPPDPQIPADIDAQINAIETLIADEMALETAFEGFRFYDLYRIARHRDNNNLGFLPGTPWFAWTIARRNVLMNPYENPTEYDNALYSKLLNQQNWFLQNPIY